MNHSATYAYQICLLLLPSLLLTSEGAWGQDPAASQPAKTDAAPTIRAGHSMHGEAFNEGPRSAAYLMAGMGKVDFPITTASPMAQRFFNQGIAQLHGFWYFEAERSFRQASAIDPACAMNYWGMALANTNNRGRAQKLIEEAKKRRSQASPREARYIDALSKYLDDESSKEEKNRRKPQQRAKDYLRDLEEISLEFPNDVEAKAIIALKLWESEREEVPLSSHLAVDALLDDIFRANPMHPAHHYRIHLWDGRRPARALDSAAKAGPSSPGIAHMWHMPGHTYSRLHRYHDAVYQQEASARVDHAHMMRDRILPDQIHNFAHNNEWLIGNMIFIGRVNDALSLAKNMISLPRHPRYNNLGGGGSSGNGRRRLFNTLDEYRLWNQALELADTIYLENNNSFDEELRNLRLLGVARVQSGRVAEADATLESLQKMREPREIEFQQLTEEPPAPAAWEATQDWQKKLKEESEKKRQQQVARKGVVEQERNKIDQAIALIQAHKKAIINDFAGASEQLRKAGDYNRLQEYEWMLAAGNRDEALKKIDSHVKDHPGEILPLAVAVWLYHQAANKDKAKEYFETLRGLAHSANLDTPMLARLTPIAEEFGFGKTWPKPYQPAPDIGERPALDLLGPMQWSPYEAPEWMVQTSSGEVLSSKQLLGKPVVVLFYLGFGCLHCVEQLQKFEPKLAEFQKAGIEVIAISTETLASLQQGITNLEKPLQLRLNSDPQLRMFQAFRCFDDFEQLPLHGTFAISPEGKVLWQDISHEPFMDPEFVLREFQRQLKIQR
ncbi:MAG: putative peroxiredoxin [Planctomycetota bacterium]|jgi:peroxiredoxin